MKKRNSVFLFLSLAFLLALFPAACKKADSPVSEESGPTADMPVTAPTEGTVSPEADTSSETNQPEAREASSKAGQAETSTPESSGQTVYALPAEDPSSGSSLSEDDVLQIALEHAGLSESDINWLRIELEYENRHTMYDVEFYSNDMEYDYEIDAESGKIVSFDQEWDKDHHRQSASGQKSSAQEPPAQAAPAVEGSFSQEEAVSLALSRMPGATEADIVSFKTDYDDGKMIYEIEIRYNGAELEMEIDADTGKILEMDYDD